MTGGNGNVQSIRRGACRKASRFHQPLCQGDRLVGDAQRWYVANDLPSPLSSITVAGGSLGDDERRDAHFERPPATRPPLVRQLLTRRRNEVPARVGGQVTDDRGFEIDSLRHRDSVA